MNMIKALAIYGALIVAAFGVQRALVKMSRDADAPIVAIAHAQASQPFGYQIPSAQLAAITAQNSTTIAADRQALTQAEQGVTP